MSLKTSNVIGIDLGTTYMVVAYIDDTGMPKVIPNTEGSFLTPSVVYRSESGETIVGQTAVNMLFLEPERTFKEFKRDIGTDKVYRKEENITITPEWCQAEELKYVREFCIKFSGDKLAGSKAVITVPAYFTEKPRQSVKHSAEMAGIQVLSLINEPTAGGLVYGLNEKQGDRLVAIMDFGGGTFDISLNKYSGGRSDVIASSGDKALGGKDIDDILLNMVKEQFKKEHALEITPESCAEDYYEIWNRVKMTKHMLSAKRETRLIVRAKGKQIAMDITRERLNQQTQPLMDRVKKITLEMLMDAKVNVGDVEGVLPIGGSSRLPAFHDLVKEIFGKDSILGGRVSPDLAVGEGAALLAANIIRESGDTLVDDSLKAIPSPTVEVSDVMPHSLGVLTQDRASDAKLCSVILKKNTTLPCSVSKMYGAVRDDQTMFSIAVVQGEEGQPKDDCLVVGQKDLTLPPRSAQKPSLEVSMAYNTSGMVNVKVNDKISGKSEDITIDFYAKKKT